MHEKLSRAVKLYDQLLIEQLSRPLNFRATTEARGWSFGDIDFGRIVLLPSGPLYDEEAAQLRSHLESRRFITFWLPICAVDFVIARRERRARDSTVVDLDVFLCNEGINPRFIGITGLSISIR